jgi:phage terminase large subunit GpA-like protein
MSLDEVRAAALRSLIPAPRLRLSEWLESSLVLPASVSALPGRLRLYPYQREICDVISDPSIERVTLVKGVRVGFSTLLVGAIGSFVVNDPCPVLALLPTESDCRDMVVSDLEPVFNATPSLMNALAVDMDGETRSTMLSRRFPGGSLKIIAARAPRNLRRHTVRVLMCDEVDAMETSAEGNPIRLAERRTMSFPNRKIICGSTPVFEDTSNILRAYADSDRRIFEVPCPECGSFTEILWEHIEWSPNPPEDAAFRCPHCKALIDERHKSSMVHAGVWRATAPEVRGHAGFRLNALVSGLTNASWGKLATEFIAAKEDPVELQVFVNTILAQGWREAGETVDEAALQARAERFGLDAIPQDVLCLTAGADLQDDRLEATVCGWNRDGVCYVLGHFVIWGEPDDDTLWREVEELLRTRWQHPFGKSLVIESCAVDSGDGEHTQKVYSFCFPRASRRVMAIKGQCGTRPIIKASATKMKGGGRLWIVGVDVCKASIFTRLQRGSMIRFSDSLEPVYYEQLASERRVVRYVRGQPIRRFERVSGRARAEALDCLVYATAARAALPLNVLHREQALRGEHQPQPVQIDPGEPTGWIGAGPNWIRDGGRR